MKLIYPIYLSLPSPLARSIQILNTCHQLALLGVDVEIICAHSCNREEIAAYYGLPPLPHNLTFTGLPALIKTPRSTIRFSTRLPWDFLLKRRVKASLKKGEQPLLYLRELKTAKALLPLIQKYNLPSVYESHRIEFRCEGAHLRELEEKIYTTVSRVASITGPLNAQMQEDFTSLTPGPILPSGCTKTDLTKLPYAKDYLFYAGQLYRWKGVDTIIEMMSYLPDEQLVLAGGAQEEDLERCKKRARECNVESRVTFLGQLAPSAIPAYAAKAKALLLPNGDELYNRSYTSPIKLFEYLCYAKPIVASKLPTIEEIVTDGKSALLAEPDNPRSFADAIEQLNSSPDLAEKLGSNALQEASLYTWETRSKNILTMLKEITNES